MEKLESLPGQKSLTFSGIVGTTCPAIHFPRENYVIDSSRYDSEGNWAFCRFDSEEIPALRMGFQMGGFNITAADRVPDKSLLQLHLEIITSDGAILWLPSGHYQSQKVVSSPSTMDILLQEEGRNIFRIRGWPEMEWRFRSEDGEAEANLSFTPRDVTLLPDCILPRCIFSMWETMADARGTVRYQDRSFRVSGKVFYDHPRIVHRVHPVVPRKMYLYTTMYFEDGGGIFGYHAADEKGNPIRYYCFGVYIDPSGTRHFLPDARLIRLDIDHDDTPRHWELRWQNEEIAVEAGIEVRDVPVRRIWGSQSARVARKDLPLVLDGRAKITARGLHKGISGRGLAEYFNWNP